jgi:isopentenyl-diphosphate delta-isomerase
MPNDHVVLVDPTDKPIGTAPKLDVHRAPGSLHRAVSAWLVDPRGRVLLQQRASTTYHFAGRWSNACCTHPRPGETPGDAIVRRVGEELGLAVAVRSVGSFTYRAADPATRLVEHELDHVYVGVVEGHPRPEPADVMDLAFVRPTVLLDRLADASRRDHYTPWLAHVMSVARLGRVAGR